MIRYDRIDELSDVCGKKKSFLSQAMGFSSRYLIDAKKQNTNIREEPLQILAKELETTVEYLRGETDDPGIKSAPIDQIDGRTLDAELIRMLAQLTPEEIRRVDDFVQGILAVRKA